MQDTMEIGFVQFPSRGEVQVIPSVLNGVRDERLDGFSRSLLKADFGWFSAAAPRELPPEDAWLDWYGNLEVTPPLPDYPLGRIYYGVADDRQFHPEIAAFLEAQELQTPAFTIDTSWLYIRHVDEVLSFVPDGQGSFRVLLTSPEAGVEFLRELAQQGYGDLTLARGLSGERTINEFLADTEAVEHNLQLQAQHIDAIAAKLKQELQLSDDRIVRVPALYGSLGDSIFPNLVNLVVLGDRLLVSDPQGPLVNDRDALQERFRSLVASTGLQVAFLDDAEYHELKGNLHCATNVRRQGNPQPFWQQLTAP
jgi:protein-arginine deiminase